MQLCFSQQLLLHGGGFSARLEMRLRCQEYSMIQISKWREVSMLFLLTVKTEQWREKLASIVIK